MRTDKHFVHTYKILKEEKIVRLLEFDCDYSIHEAAMKVFAAAGSFCAARNGSSPS